MSDALRHHLEATKRIDWRQPSADLARRLAALSRMLDSRGLPDAHEEFIARHDATRDSARAERMFSALAVLREWARQGRAVSWPGLCEVQKIVLGEEAGFRRAIALAKGGAERYGLWPTLEKEFSDKIALDDGDGTHPIAGAVRLYLDVCFFHPFHNGNARAARLWFDYLLRRGGFRPAFVEPMFLVERFAGNPADYLDFVRLTLLSCERAQYRHEMSEA